MAIVYGCLDDVNLAVSIISKTAIIAKNGISPSGRAKQESYIWGKLTYTHESPADVSIGRHAHSALHLVFVAVPALTLASEVNHGQRQV